MCDVLGRFAALPDLPPSNRRKFLQLLGASAAAGGLVVAGADGATAAPATSTAPSSAASGGGLTRLILLGTNGGPTLPNGDRFGISTAIVHNDQAYIVDLGHGSLLRLRQSSASGPLGVGSLWNKTRGVFFTHMHSDHLTEWPAAWATVNANAAARPQGSPKIQVFGPGNRGTLPRVFPPTRPAPAPYNPSNPTPGLVETTQYLTQAWSNDFNDRLFDSNFPGPQTVFSVQDIDLRGIWAPDRPGKPPLLDAPIPVWTDGTVKITATLVDHHPTAPAFAFRFDTPDASVTVSGDTAVSQNLINLAQGTDYLVHEVIDPVWVERLVATLPPEQQAPLRQHLLESHTTIEQVGRDVAERAGAKNLVLSHLVPGDNPESRWQEARKGYSGKLIVGKDLMELRVR